MDTAGKAKPNNAAGNTTTSSSFITLNRKGNTMSHTTTFRRGMSALVALVLFIGLAMGQNLVINNGSTFNGTGTINVKGNITTPTLTEDKTINGKVVMAKASGTQSIGSVGETQTLTFQKLEVSTGSGTTQQEVATVVVSDSLSVANTSTFDIQAKTLSIAKISVLNGTGTLDVSDATSVVNFTRGDGVAQTVLGLNYGGTLNLSGSTSGKSFAAAGSAVNMTHDGGDLTVNQAWSIGTSGTFDTIANISSSLTFAAAASGTKTIAVITTMSGTLTDSASTGSLAITTLSGNTGSINAIGAGDMTITTATNGTGSITASGGDVTIATLSGNAGTIQTTGAGLLAFSGTSANSGTIKTTGAGSITFTGAATNNDSIYGSTGSTGAITFSNTLLNVSGADVIAGPGVLTFAGVVTNQSGAFIKGDDANDTIDFNANVDNSGTISLAANASALFAASFVTSGTLSLNAASNWSYDGLGAQNMAGGTTVTYGNLFTEGSGTKTALDSMTIAGNFDNGGVNDVSITTDMNTFALNVAGTRTNKFSTLRFGGLTNGLAFATTDTVAGTVIYDASTVEAATQTIAAGSYFALQFENNAPKNMTTNTTVSTGSSVALASNVTVNVPQTSGTTTLNVGLTGQPTTGSLTLASSAVLVSAGTLNVAGDIDVTGTFTNNGTATIGW